jgi:hypothetical protein
MSHRNWVHLLSTVMTVSEQEASLLSFADSYLPRATPTPASDSYPTVEEFAADASNFPPFTSSQHRLERGKPLFEVWGCLTIIVTVVDVHNHF